MPRGMTFEEALEAALRSAEDAFAPAPRASAPPAPPLSFVFLKSGVRRSFGTAYGAAASRAAARPVAAMPSARPAPAAPIGDLPPLPELTERQREALRGLVSLGAMLPPNFTARELRSAFRALARHYHPDRHPTSSRAERARLSQTFADAVAQYRCLLDALLSTPVKH